MPDDVKPDEKKVEDPKPPVVDPKMIQEAVTSALAARDEQENARRVAQASAAAQKAKGEDPVRKVVLESLGDDLGQISFNSNNALDLARFYTLHPEAKEFAVDVERKFTELAGAGNAQDRESIWNWYRGANLDKFVARSNAQKQAQEEEAANAFVAGSGGGGVPRGTKVIRDPHSMTPDELEKALEGMSF